MLILLAKPEDSVQYMQDWTALLHLFVIILSLICINF